MANYQQLKSAIQTAINNNGQGAITGQVLQDTLINIVDNVGFGYAYAGIASPNAVPQTTDSKVFYIATQGGVYSSFGGVSVTEGLSIIKYDNQWQVQLILAADQMGGGGSSSDKGLFPSSNALNSAYPSPEVGWWALVGTTSPYTLYDCVTQGTWRNTGQTAEIAAVKGGQSLSGYIGFSAKNNPADITTQDLTAVTDEDSYNLTNNTEGYFLWVMSISHITVESGGIKLPLYYIGTKNNLHVYRSEAMGVGSFFATFGIGNPNEPIDVVPILYTLTYSMQHISASGPQTIMSTDQVTIFLTADDGYSLPEEVEVTNASVVSYDDETGTLVIGSATGNVTVTAAGVVQVFSVTNNLSSVTNSNDATTAAYGSAYNATLTPASGYEITALSVTMGGVPVSVSDNTIEIASVTGDIVITAVAETAGKVTVNVTSGGVAVPGALVTITIDDEEYTGTTNGNGTVLIVSAVGNGTIKVEKEGYTTYTNTIAVGTGSQTTNISISEIPTYTISGECNVDEVTLTIGTHTVEVENGAYSLSGVLAGTYAISCEGYSVSPSSVTVVDDDVDLDITLAELSSLSGTVKTELGAAVSGATVLLQVGGEPRTTTTSSTGEYSFADVPAGAATLSVTTSTGTVTESLTLVSGANTKDMETRVALPSGNTRYDWGHFDGNDYAAINSITITHQTKVAVKFRYDGDGSSNHHVFGAAVLSDPQTHVRMCSTTDKLRVYWGKASDQGELGIIAEDVADNVNHNASVGPDGFIVDGVKKGDIHQGEFSYSGPFGIGALRVNSYQQNFYGYIYWVKIYENDVLTHYYVPITINTGVNRFYDLVAKGTISGNGKFAVGNDE